MKASLYKILLCKIRNMTILKRFENLSYQRLFKNLIISFILSLSTSNWNFITSPFGLSIAEQIISRRATGLIIQTLYIAFIIKIGIIYQLSCGGGDKRKFQFYLLRLQLTLTVNYICILRVVISSLFNCDKEQGQDVL